MSNKNNDKNNLNSEENEVYENREIDETSDESIEESTNITKYEFQSQLIQWSLGFLVKKVDDKRIILDPNFQRLPTAWKETRKQNLVKT